MGRVNFGDSKSKSGKDRILANSVIFVILNDSEESKRNPVPFCVEILHCIQDDNIVC